MNLRFEKINLDNCELAIKIYDDNHKLKTNLAKLKEQLTKLQSNEDYYNMVVYLDDEVVGMFTAIINHDVVEELKPFMTVWNLGVSKEHRRKGIGSKMLEYIFDLAENLGCDFVALIAESNNIPAIKMYEKAKYKMATGFVRLINKDEW